MKQKPFLFLVSALLLCLSFPTQAFSQSIIRDTELEDTIKTWSEPLIHAAGLSPKSVNIIFVQDSGVNAFVAGGANIFIYSGLIERADNPDELLGVIAHELGHISGGHLIRTNEALRNASYETILGTIVGLGAAILTGESAVASAVTTASSSTATRRFLVHSRAHESSADQAALTYIKQTDIDPKGLVTFFGKLQDQELLPQTQQLEYVRTHPLTRNRVEAIETKAKEAQNYGRPISEEKQDQFERLKAKLKGFINPQHVELTYSQKDTSIPATYARAIANYRLFKKEAALKDIDVLIKQEPKNPYFLELKGQMLVDFGDVSKALPYYKKALSIMPNSGLIRTAYAHALIESNTPDNTQLKEAIKQLKQAQIQEPRALRIPRLLATAYGQIGEEGKANLYLAEEALLKGQRDYARQFVTIASKSLEKGSADWYRAQDILNFLGQLTEKG